MHPLAITQYGHTVTESRSRRRRKRRTAIAVVAGLLAVPGGQAFADPPQQQFRSHPQPHVRGPQGWHQAAPTHLPSGHHVTGGRTIPDPAPAAVADDGGTNVDWEIPVIVAASLLTAGGLALTQRHRVRTAA
jgi:hypothetical protein